MVNPISKKLCDHYFSTFESFGANSKGVDWGEKQWAADLRNKNMLAVIKDLNQEESLLDVGCGYGALGEIIAQKNLPINYSGIDIAQNMIDHAHSSFGGRFSFFCEDFLEWDCPNQYNYIVCNGILTQKLETSYLEMHEYSKELIKKMFKIANKGIAFNCMSTFVNYQKENLFYKNPSELITWCMSELSPRVRLDASYDLFYEYTVYLYK